MYHPGTKVDDITLNTDATGTLNDPGTKVNDIT